MSEQNKVCAIYQPNEAEFETSTQIAMEQRDDNILYSGRELSRASIVNRKCWKPGSTITISFLNGDDEDQEFVQKIGNEWTQYANLKFDWVSVKGMVRIRFGNQGSWCMMGTDCLMKKSGSTLEYGWVDRSVVLHELGHMLGLNHSHNSLNFPYHFREDEVIKDLKGPPNKWNVDMIRYNVLEKTKEGVSETPWEADNIMNYHCPANWIVEGVAISPGENIGKGEIELVKQIYPEGVTSKTISVNQTVRGEGNQEYEFDCISGLYIARITPRNTTILINGRKGLISLRKGSHRVNVIGKSSWEFTIKKF